jgi:sRNA-binding carbon storage regulator CsrA
VAEIRPNGEFGPKVKLGFDADKDISILRDNAKKIS